MIMVIISSINNNNQVQDSHFQIIWNKFVVNNTEQKCWVWLYLEQHKSWGETLT
jgi:hypothetical protein